MGDHIDYEGQQLGNYRLLHLLGQGGFAEVYLAEHIYLKTQAAVKLLLARLAQDDLAKFQSEAQTIARLSHPNIVRVLDFGVAHNAPYLAMEYAPNGTLRSRHPKGSRLPLDTVVTYVRQIAEALQYAHDQRLIHRDVKPENMLLGRNNEVLLSDFGIALVTQSSHYPTSTQNVAGTISYMAPEQIQAHPRPASDQYSLGIVVYEWLSGERPFRGSFTEIAVKHTMTPPPPLRDQVPSLPPAIEEVVMTALKKEPNQRFPTIRDFAEALQQASHGVSFFSTHIAAPQLPSPDGSIAPPASHNMEPNPLALQYDPKAPSNSLPPASPSNAASSDQTLSPPPWARALLSQKRSERRTVVAAMIGLAALASSGLTWFIFSQQKTLGSIRSPLSTNTGSTSPSNANSGSHPTPTTITTALLAYSGHTDIILGVQWSPDGRSIASCSQDGTAQVWSADKAERLLSYRSNIAGGFLDYANAVAWSPDSKRIAIAFMDGTAQIVDVASGHLLASYSASSGSLRAIAWSPDGRYIVTGGEDNIAWVYDVSAGNRVATLTGHTGEITSLAWSPDGKRIASGSEDNQAKVWNPLSGKELLNYAEDNEVYAVAWSNDSKHVASGSWNLVCIWDATTGKALVEYKHMEGPVKAFALSPDNTHIAASDSSASYIWDADTGAAIRKFDTFAISSVSWSPDGTRIVTGGFKKVAQVWPAK